jgi:Putative Actinobacterial Holin-X, holin superfamily III
MDVPHMDRSLGELFSDLSQQTADLVRQEMRLAKAELGDKLSDVGRHATMIAAAAVFGVAAVLAVTAGIVLLLIDLGVEPWLAAGITAAGLGLTAFLLAQSAVSALRKKSIAPVETMHSLKETAQWLKNPSTR